MLHSHHRGATALLAIGLFACSGSRNQDTTRGLNGMERDAGDAEEPELDAEPETQEPDAEPEPEPDAAVDTESDAQTAGDASALDATGSLDADDAGLDAGSDTGTDSAASQEAGPGDGSTNDAGPTRTMVYATFGTTLVRIDPDTAELTEVGTLRNIDDVSQTYSDVVMTWTGDGASAWMVTSYFQTPTLATANLCDATVRLGPAFSRTPTTPPLVVEGLALHPNGNFYVSSGNPASVNSPISNHIGTLNTATGVITDLGVAVTALQADIDMLFVRADVLYGVDVVTNNSRLGLYTINLETGKDITVAAPTYAGGTTQVPLRVAYDASRDKAFAWRPSDRNLVAFDMTTAAVTAIGETHPSTAYANAPSRGFFVAPEPLCPSPGS